MMQRAWEGSYEQEPRPQTGRSSQLGETEPQHSCSREQHQPKAQGEAGVLLASTGTHSLIRSLQRSFFS